MQILLPIFLLLFSYYSYGQSCESYTNQVRRYAQQIHDTSIEANRIHEELRKAENDFNRAKAKERQSKQHVINYQGKGLDNWIKDKEALAEAHCKLIKIQAQSEIVSTRLGVLKEALKRASAGRRKYCPDSYHQLTPEECLLSPGDRQCQQSRQQPKSPWRQLPVRPADRKNPPQIRPLPAHSSDKGRYQLRQLKETLPGKTVPVTQ